MFLAPRHRRGQVRVAWDGTSSLGHVVESLGVPLTVIVNVLFVTPLIVNVPLYSGWAAPKI